MKPQAKQLASLNEREHKLSEGMQDGDTMRTSLVDTEDATARLESGEQPYAFELSDRVTMVGPACGYGTAYLKHLRVEGRYVESIQEAIQVAATRGATVTGVWFVQREIPAKQP